MKYKTTQKFVKTHYEYVIKVGYCKLAYLLSWENPEAYTVRREGWGADIYGFGNTAIVTGYAPFGNITPDYEMCREYEELAREICHDSSISYEEQRFQIDALLERFLEEATA